MKGYVSLVLLLSFASCAKSESSTTQTPITAAGDTSATQSASSTDTTTLTPDATVSTTTQAPTTTAVSTTTQGPTTTQASITMTVSTTTQGPTTTQAPTVSTTTQGPTATQASITTTVSTTTQGPTATQASITTTVSTTTQGPTATQAPKTTTGDISATQSASSTEAPLPCANKPCGGSAKCVNLYQGYMCQCPYGYYYSRSRCQEGKVFPGLLTLKTPYTDSMAKENSPEYQQLYKNVTDFFNTTFKNETDYGETIIVNIKQSSAKSKIQIKAETSGTSVTISNMFEVTTKLNADAVANLTEEALKGHSYFNNDSYQKLSQCDIYGCDEATTDCVETDGLKCTCKSGYSKKDKEEKTCSDCDNTCSEENHRHCVTGKNSNPVCQCLPNFKNKDGNCVKCDVGYSGVNCSNNSLLILIIVAVLCGALILGLAAGLIFTSIRANKRQKNPEKRHLLREDYSDNREIPGLVSAINPAANEKIFPTIQTSNGSQVNQGSEISNPYEMGPRTRRLPERDYDDDEFETTSKGDAFRLQHRY
ncbi:mucin-13 isoform X3 [Chelonia mydas]|uniref:mucin-13 isoform X3 n=1 Tax=Chelonia mydas TaxID=8469 RepID=UPI001CA8BC66|nr:mucin-13 isoform X3 [Chelonia mydas]